MIVAPALHKFYGIRWTWVSVDDLVEILGHEAEELFHRFWWLGKDAPQYGVLALTDGVEFRNFRLNEVNYGGPRIYVPAGWADDVLKAHRKGYVRVTLEQHFIDETDELPENWLNVSHCTGVHNLFWVAVGYKE